MSTISEGNKVTTGGLRKGEKPLNHEEKPRACRKRKKRGRSDDAG